MARASDVSSNRRFILVSAIAAWLPFAASFLMPVVSELVGWEAFWFYLSKTLEPVDFWRHVQGEPLSALIVTFSPTNIAMLIAPVVLWLWPRWSGWLGLLLVLGGLVPCVCFHEMVANRELSYGYYCWVGSIFLMAGVCFWNWLWPRRNAAHH